MWRSKKKLLVLENYKEDSKSLHILDLKTGKIVEEIDLGCCEDCGKRSNKYELKAAVCRGDILMTVCCCRSCINTFLKIWRQGKMLGQMKKRYVCNDGEVIFYHDSKFLIFKIDQTFNIMSWGSIENNDLASMKTVDFFTRDYIEFFHFIVDEDKVIVVGSQNGSLYIANLTVEKKIDPLPSIFPPHGDKGNQRITSMIKFQKNRYVVASNCEGQ